MRQESSTSSLFAPLSVYTKAASLLSWPRPSCVTLLQRGGQSGSRILRKAIIEFRQKPCVKSPLHDGLKGEWVHVEARARTLCLGPEVMGSDGFDWWAWGRKFISLWYMNMKALLARDTLETESENRTDVRGAVDHATCWCCQQWVGSLTCKGQKPHRQKLFDTDACSLKERQLYESQANNSQLLEVLLKSPSSI